MGRHDEDPDYAGGLGLEVEPGTVISVLSLLALGVLWVLYLNGCLGGG